LFAGGGILAMVLGFALKEIGENICAGILLSFNRPFKIGDLIKSGDCEGVVQAIEIRSTHIRSSDGRDIFVPCAQIYKNTLINYTKDGLRRFTLKIGVSYESDLDGVCETISEEMGKVNAILKAPKASVSVTQTFPSYIEVGMNFWVNVLADNSNVGKIKTDLMGAVKGALKDQGVVLSNEIYDNVNFKVIHDGAIVGKEGEFAH
jgi:small conductance mechanosensitive channel